MYEKIIKRLLDIIISFFGIVFLSPLFIILIVIGAIEMKGNPFFAQERPGRNEKVFRLFKFRTMNNAKDKDGNLLPDEQRVSRYGRILRSTSLDELPELFNILKGDMSLVGPRPLLVSYLPYYTEEERHRHDVRPGLTGLAQVKGRSFLPWEEIFAFDLEYINNCSFGSDVSILFQTVRKVFSGGEIADVGTLSVDKDGTTWVMENGEKRRLHSPLDVERRNRNAE